MYAEPTTMASLAESLGTSEQRIRRVAARLELPKGRKSKAHLKMIAEVIRKEDRSTSTQIPSEKRPKKTKRRTELKIGDDTIRTRLEDQYREYELNQVSMDNLSAQISSGEASTATYAALEKCMRLKIAQDKNINELEATIGGEADEEGALFG